MCANFKPITIEQIRALDLPEMHLDFDSEIYPNYESPLLFKSEQGLEWRSVNFGLIPKWANDKTDVKFTYNARNETLLEKTSFQ